MKKLLELTTNELYQIIDALISIIAQSSTEVSENLSEYGTPKEYESINETGKNYISFLLSLIHHRGVKETIMLYDLFFKIDISSMNNLNEELTRKINDLKNKNNTHHEILEVIQKIENKGNQ